MAEIEIRLCLPGDLPVVSGLMRQLAEVTVTSPDKGFEVEHMEKIYRQMAAYPDVYLNLVAVVEGQVAGFISLVFYKTFYHRTGTALINELIVDRARRSMGIGSALLARARAEAVARDMEELEVGTERDNQHALRFYRGHGFDEEYVLLGMEFDA